MFIHDYASLTITNHGWYLQLEMRSHEIKPAIHYNPHL